MADAAALGTGARTWRPIFLFELIGLGSFEPATVELLVQLGYLALVLGILGVLTRTSCALAAGISILITGLVYSCGKVHHDKVALAFAMAGAAPRAGTATAVGAEGEALGAAPGAAHAGDDRARLYLGRREQAALKRARVVQWLHADGAPGAPRQALVQGSFALVFVLPRARWIYLPAAHDGHRTYVTLWLLIAFVPLESANICPAKGTLAGACFPASGQCRGGADIR